MKVISRIVQFLFGISLLLSSIDGILFRVFHNSRTHSVDYDKLSYFLPFYKWYAGDSRGYFSFFYLVCAVCFLSGRFTPLGLLLISPIFTLAILDLGDYIFFPSSGNSLLNLVGSPEKVFIAISWLYLLIAHWSIFKVFFKPRAELSTPALVSDTKDSKSV
jgi:hypothetical protein